MHLEEMFQYIEEKRSELIANRAEKACLTGSTAGVFPQEQNNSHKSPTDESQAVLTQVEVTT